MRFLYLITISHTLSFVLWCMYYNLTITYPSSISAIRLSFSIFLFYLFLRRWSTSFPVWNFGSEIRLLDYFWLITKHSGKTTQDALEDDVNHLWKRRNCQSCCTECCYVVKSWRRHKLPSYREFHQKKFLSKNGFHFTG